MEQIPREMSLIVLPETYLTFPMEEVQSNWMIQWDRRQRYYPKLKTLIMTYGVWELNFRDLARQWNVPKTTVHHWKHKVLQEMEVNDIEQIKEDLKLTSIANIKNIQRLIRSTNSEKIKVIALKVHAELIEKFTTFLERFEYKRKIADRLDINQKTISISFDDPHDKYPKLDEN